VHAIDADQEHVRVAVPLRMAVVVIRLCDRDAAGECCRCDRGSWQEKITETTHEFAPLSFEDIALDEARNIFAAS
jgi:hypothetical protein